MTAGLCSSAQSGATAQIGLIIPETQVRILARPCKSPAASGAFSIRCAYRHGVRVRGAQRRPESRLRHVRGRPDMAGIVALVRFGGSHRRGGAVVQQRAGPSFTHRHLLVDGDRGLVGYLDRAGRDPRAGIRRQCHRIHALRRALGVSLLGGLLLGGYVLDAAEWREPCADPERGDGSTVDAPRGASTRGTRPVMWTVGSLARAAGRHGGHAPARAPSPPIRRRHGAPPCLDRLGSPHVAARRRRRGAPAGPRGYRSATMAFSVISSISTVAPPRQRITTSYVPGSRSIVPARPSRTVVAGGTVTAR